MAATANTSTMMGTASASSHREFKIGGLSVMFPCKPYPSQFSMMDKIIRGIQRQQNCLLESPTGSGKSLALLCSALAWQTKEKAKQSEEIAQQAAEKKEAGDCCCSCHRADAGPAGPGQASGGYSATTLSSSRPVHGGDAACAAACSDSASPSAAARSAANKSAAGWSPVLVFDDDSDDEFRPLKKFRSSGKSITVTSDKKRKPLSIEYEDSAPPAASTLNSEPPSASAFSSAPAVVTPCSKCSCGKEEKISPRKVPKIYFGTRTHKQVAQIVRELRKTAYSDVAMTILASREHTCIHPEISCAPNKNEGCENLVKETGCRFKDRVMKYQSQHAIKSLGLCRAWDLEDMVTLMRKKKVCPYFLTRGLKDQSDLIICPYNYLVDPLIRNTMEITLKDQIVMLDEAHNIEDAAREAASQSFTQEQIQRALHDMDELVNKNVNVADISKLRQMCHKLEGFMEEHSSSLTQHDFEQSYRLWSGFEIVAQLNKLDLGAEKCKELSSTLQKLKSAEAEERANGGAQDDTAKLSSASGSLLESVFLVMKYIYMDNMKHAEDYRASIVKSIRYVPADHNGSWLNSRRRFGGRRTVPVETFTLNFWCMNPAVGFADFGLCRSVILTSGTLSPMGSFQSELGLPFPVALEANHVIKDSQVWVGAVGEGLDGTSLQAVYRNMETFGFQDQLGQLILSVCKKVPKGVLCFLPSYKTLEKLSSRWKTTGLWKRLETEKQVFSEPRGSDKAEFERIMMAFSSVVSRTPDQNNEDGGEGSDGALLFAVCRGKVSEGMDFADNSARAVITVGIPYPNFKDIQVELKRKYNDHHAASRQLLSGHLWYEIQAFRALNQALGRCIRHRLDWGALIIVDDRFVKNTNKYANGLSKWVRQKLKVHGKCGAMLESLSLFTAARLEEQQQQQRDSSNTSVTSTPLAPASKPMHCNSPRLPLDDVSNFPSPSAASTPRGTGSPLLSTVLSTKDFVPKTAASAQVQVKHEMSDAGSSPMLERRAVHLLSDARCVTSSTGPGPVMPVCSSLHEMNPPRALVNPVPDTGKTTVLGSQEKTDFISSAVNTSPAAPISTGVDSSQSFPALALPVPLVPIPGKRSAYIARVPLVDAAQLSMLHSVTVAPVLPSPNSSSADEIISVPSNSNSSRTDCSKSVSCVSLMCTSGSDIALGKGDSRTHLHSIASVSENTRVITTTELSSKPCPATAAQMSTASRTAIPVTTAAGNAKAKCAAVLAEGEVPVVADAFRLGATLSGVVSGLGLVHPPTVADMLAVKRGEVASKVISVIVIEDTSAAATSDPVASASDSPLDADRGIPNRTMSLLHVPVGDPSVPVSMLLLPQAPPSQHRVPVPSHLQQAVGAQNLWVPPNISCVVMAPTPQEANELFMSCVKSTRKMVTTSVFPVNPADAALGSASSPQPRLSPLASAGSPALFDDIPQSPPPSQLLLITKPSSGEISITLLDSEAEDWALAPAQTSEENKKNAPVLDTQQTSGEAVNPLKQAMATFAAHRSQPVNVSAGPPALPSHTVNTDARTVPRTNKKRLFRNTPSKTAPGSNPRPTASPVAGAPTADVKVKNVMSSLDGWLDQERVKRRVKPTKRHSLTCAKHEAKRERHSDVADQEPVATMK